MLRGEMNDLLLSTLSVFESVKCPSESRRLVPERPKRYPVLVIRKRENTKLFRLSGFLRENGRRIQLGRTGSYFHRSVLIHKVIQEIPKICFTNNCRVMTHDTQHQSAY